MISRCARVASHAAAAHAQKRTKTASALLQTTVAQGVCCWRSWSHAARTCSTCAPPALVVRSSHHQPQKHMRRVTEGADGRADSTRRQYSAALGVPAAVCSTGARGHTLRVAFMAAARVLQQRAYEPTRPPPSPSSPRGQQGRLTSRDVQHMGGRGARCLCADNWQVARPVRHQDGGIMARAG